MKKSIGLILGASLLISSFGIASAQETKSFDSACIIKAVNKREDTLLTAIDTRHTSHKNALSARKGALTTAWALTDKNARNTAIKKAWSDFKTASNSAMATFKSTKETTWKTFNTERKACKTPSSPDQTSSSVDSKL